jgi:tetrahydromethanopterin S-methyltransferase subunit A
MRVIGSMGKRPVLRNVTRDEVETFRRQVQVIDMIGCDDETKIIEKLKKVAQQVKRSCGCETCVDENVPMRISNVPVIEAKELTKVEMDKAGYFVILPQPEKKIILVEHYSYDNTLLRIIEGKDARSLYWTIIENKFVTQLSHAAYLGKELEKAELSIQFGFKYVQDGA